jgi:sulfatase maturation enzyme AslB (radical SAM superfamily)
LEYAFEVIPSDVTVKIITNGTLTKSEQVRDLLQKQAHRLMLILSVDGSQEWHDANRIFPDGRGSWALIDFDFLLGMEWKALSASVVATLNNVDSLFDRVKFLYEMGFRQFGVSVDHTRIWNNDKLWLYERELCQLAKFMRRVKDITYLVPLSVIDGFEREGIKPCLCVEGYSELTIDVDGSVTSCKGISDIFGRILPWSIKLGHINNVDKEDFGFTWGVDERWCNINERPSGCDKCLASYRCGCVPMRYIKGMANVDANVRELFESICNLNNIEHKVWSCNNVQM